MSTTYITPSISNHPRMPDPSYNHARADHYSRQGTDIVLDTPQQRSTDTFPSRKTSYDSYLPTPQSAISLDQQQRYPTQSSTSQQPFMQQQSQNYQYPQHHEWHPQPIAGPSNYRRTPHIASPMSVSSEILSRAPSEQPSPAKTKMGDRAIAQGEQVMVEGIRRMHVSDGDGRIGVDEPFGERSYTEMKCLGDGSFGTVWLCDWHSPVKADVLLSAMQCGAGARPEWAGKRLVALKRMKRVWEGGWSQAKNLGEIKSLAQIPPHPAIIPLYDAFISPKSRELYFVFECMEGNLYQLTKSRRGRQLAAGLVASCFHQISTGLHHIHQHGYFHRDMKPENLLVTTTGLADYLTADTLAHINAQRNGRGISEGALQNGHEIRYEKDVSVIVKLADFGLARMTSSKPPYTEYVSTRWYRAPEVLLRSTEYGPPVDMWALGTILAEMLNLKPLFPGVSEIDQVYRICDTLGDPSPDYGVDERGKIIGGGNWVSGVKLAKNVGFAFPKRTPVNFQALFKESVPQSLVDCISDLLRYNPKYRMTAAQCVDHPYFHETLPHLQQTPPLPRIPFSHGQPAAGLTTKPTELNAPPRQVPPSHSHHEPRPAFANGDMRTLPPPVGTPDQYRAFFPTDTGRHGPSALVHQLRELDLPTDELHSYGHRNDASPTVQVPAQERPAAVQQQWSDERRTSNAQSTYYDGSVFEGDSAISSNPSFSQFNLSAARMRQQQMPSQTKVANFVQAQQQIQMYEDGSSPSHPHIPPPIEPAASASQLSLASTTPGKLTSVTSGKKKKWGLSSVFGGGDKSVTSLAPVDEVGYTGSTASLKRTQSGNTPVDRLRMSSTTSLAVSPSDDPKSAKKEAERAKKEAELIRREAAAMKQKERARAVMLKRQQTLAGTKDPMEYASSGFTSGADVLPRQANIHQEHHHGHPGVSVHRDMRDMPGLPGTQSEASLRDHESVHSHPSVHSHHSRSEPQLALNAQQMYELGGRHKARRRDEDDDHSMSSFDRNSLRSRSVLTIGTIDSDPGPRRGRLDLSDPHLPRTFTKDPLMAKRGASTSSFQHTPSRLASMSNPSFESQLAHDFMAQANVQGGGSTTSLGKLSNHALGPGQPYLQGQGQGSAPTSPYGHPKAVEVSLGSGFGRHGMVDPLIPRGHGHGHGHGQVLPSIKDWEGQEGKINPMFKVPTANDDSRRPHPEAPPGTTLPPFSDIARVADTHRKQTR